MIKNAILERFRGDLEEEILKDIFESNYYIIFINADTGVEESNLPDILEYWIL